MLSLPMMAGVLAVLAPGADAPTLDWKADYGESLQQCKQEGQPLLVVFENPADESGQLAPELLEAENLPLDSYALCRIDASTEYGQQVAEGFRVTEFPHVAIIDKTGSVIVRRVKGEVAATEWRSILSRHEQGLRRGATQYTVAKPVVSETTTPATSTVIPSTISPMPAYSAPVYSSPQPYCPSCQRR